MTEGLNATYSDGTKIRATKIGGGYHRVTFSRPLPEDDMKFFNETCDWCPCLSACSNGRRCVKNTAYATEGL